MKLSDLRDGMVVTYRNGDRRTVKGDDLRYTEHGSNMLSDFKQKFTEDLLYNGSSTEQRNLDIMKVEVPSSVWEREEISKEQQEITDIREQMEELATRLKQLEGST